MLTNEKHEGIIEYYEANGVHAPGAYRYFTIQVPTGQFYANGDPILQDLNVANAVTMYSANNDYSTLSEIDCYPNGTLALYANNATLSNVTVWSADSILTQGRADSRYATPACLTYSNISGTPVLATVATSGSYADLSNRPDLSVYQLASTNTWANLTGRPTLAAVATSGSYADLSSTPNLSLYLTSANAASTYVPIASNGTANTTFDSAGSTVTLSGSNIAYNGFRAFDGTRQSIMGLSGSTTSAATVPTMRQDANISGFTQTACVSFSALTSVLLSSLRKSCGTESVISGGCITLGTTSGVTIVGLSDSAANQTSLAINSTGLKITSTGTATTWTSASVLTQGYADTRYQAIGNYLTQANLTYSNLSGTPTLAAVATSGNYNDLSNKPSAYTLPAATNTTLGGIIVGSNLTIANGVLSAVASGGSGGGIYDGGSAFSSDNTFDGGSATGN